MITVFCELVQYTFFATILETNGRLLTGLYLDLTVSFWVDMIRGLTTAIFQLMQNSPLSSDRLTTLAIAGIQLSRTLINNHVVKMSSLKWFAWHFYYCVPQVMLINFWKHLKLWYISCCWLISFSLVKLLPDHVDLLQEEICKFIS